jgi:hypothetical protein
MISILIEGDISALRTIIKINFKRDDRTRF